MRAINGGRQWWGGLVLAMLAIVVATGVGTAQSASAPGGTVVGTVRDSAGAPVIGAELLVEGANVRTRSDGAGRFRLAGAPAGRQALSVRRVGYLPIQTHIAVPSDTRAITEIEVRLTQVALRLAPVAVRGHRDPSDARLAGFNERRAKRRGYYVTRDRIERASNGRLTDLLREVPGLRIVAVRGGPSRGVRMRGAACPPLVFVDGFPASAGEFDLDIVDVKGLEGIEIYPDMMSVPPELLGPRGLDQCGVIALWSHPGGPPSAEPDTVPMKLVEERLARRRAYRLDQVDRPAVLERGTAIAAYPDSLWRAGVAGRALIEFVVDSRGQVDGATLSVVSATDPRFATAARSAVASARFTPALLRGRPVAQVVQLPFVFEPTGVRPEPDPDVKNM